MTDDELIRQARAVINPGQTAHGFTVGDVGWALVQSDDPSISLERVGARPDVEPKEWLNKSRGL